MFGTLRIKKSSNRRISKRGIIDECCNGAAGCSWEEYAEYCPANRRNRNQYLSYKLIPSKQRRPHIFISFLIQRWLIRYALYSSNPISPNPTQPFFDQLPRKILISRFAEQNYYHDPKIIYKFHLADKENITCFC